MVVEWTGLEQNSYLVETAAASCVVYATSVPMATQWGHMSQCPPNSLRVLNAGSMFSVPFLKATSSRSPSSRQHMLTNQQAS